MVGSDGTGVSVRVWSSAGSAQPAVLGRRKARRAPRHGWSEEMAREYLRSRSRGVCEICGAARATELSHRQTRAVSGFCPCNAMHLCHLCHADRVHAQPKMAMLYGWVVSRHLADGARLEPVWLPVLDRWLRLDCFGGVHNAVDPNP